MEWLASLGLSEHAQLFADNRIDDPGVLPHLTDQDLKDIGVPLGHRRKMLAAIAQLADTKSAVPDPAPQGDPKPQDSAERRQLTVMFCDLVGSTALSARLDPEDMRDVIRAYQDACSGVIARYDGFVAKFMGDGILAYFGFPRAHEDEPERAVRAGLDIVAAVGRLKPSGEALQVRLGVATGLVVVGDLVGEGPAQERAVTGDTPNLAARLQALAAPGMLVIAASSRRLVGDLFELRSLGSHLVKGLADPVEAWAVDGVAASESRFEAARAARLTGFVGREHEIALLLDRKARAWQGEGQIALISGEAGLGKSRLALTLAERLADEPHTRLRYQCSPYHTNSALHPFIMQFERAAGVKLEDPPERKLDKLETMLALGTSRVRDVAPLFAALLSIPSGDRYPAFALSPAQQRRQTLAAILDQLEGLAGRNPVLVLFEDAHWADATSLELLDLMTDRLRRLPVLAIITSRPGFEPSWAGLPNVAALSLARFDRSLVEAMIAKVAGGRNLPTEVTRQIVAKTDGVPLFVEELTKTVLEAGILTEGADGYRLDGPLPPLAIPATLHDSLMARLDRLAPVKEVAQVGAAIGREFSYGLLLSVLARDDAHLRSALAELEQSELLFRRGEAPDAVYTFKHALVQDAAYESLLKSRRQVLHRRIAEVLRGRFPAIAEAEPEVVAHHLTQAGLTEPAIEWWRKSGDLALGRSAYNEAVGHLEKAIGLAESLTESPEQRLLRLRLQIALGNALLSARGYHARETTMAFARARELAAGLDAAPERLSAYYGLWVSQLCRAEHVAAREAADALLQEAERQSWPPAAAVAHRVFGTHQWFQGDAPSAQPHLELALRIYDAERDHGLAFRFGQDVSVAAKNMLAFTLWQLGEIDRARLCGEDAVLQADQSGHIPTIAYAHFWKCIFEMVRRDVTRASVHAEVFVGLGREHDLPIYIAAGAFVQRWARMLAGDRGTGPSALHESNGVLLKMGFRLCEPLFAACVAEAEANERNVEAALDILDHQLVETERSGQRWYDAELHRVRGELLLRRDPTETSLAEHSLLRAIEIARGQHARSFELRAALSLAKLYHATRRIEEARALLAPALVGFSEGPELPEVGEAKRLLAALEQTSGALA